MLNEELKHKCHRKKNGCYERNLIAKFGLIERIRIIRYRYKSIDFENIYKEKKNLLTNTKNLNQMM